MGDDSGDTCIVTEKKTEPRQKGPSIMDENQSPLRQMTLERKMQGIIQKSTPGKCKVRSIRQAVLLAHSIGSV
jgi:hypothetical protein